VGFDYYGQLGIGTMVDKSSPVQVSSLTSITAIAADGNHSLFLKNDGTVWAVGNNFYGQLGDGTTDSKSTPVQVSPLTGITAIAAGGLHSLFLKNDGTVWAVGRNNNGQLGDGTTVNKSTPVQVSVLCVPFSASISSQTNVSCNGGSNGRATVTVSGGAPPYSYSWSNGQTTATATGLSAGTHTVTVTDNTNSTASVSVTITQPSALIASISSSTNVNCYGDSNGSATATVSGGTPPYSYSWSNGQTVATATGLSVGTYTVTITDANGCSSTAQITITGNALPDVTVSNNANTLTANQAGASYLWIDCNNNNAPISGETSQSFVPSTSGVYAVIVILNGCSGTSSCQNVIVSGVDAKLLSKLPFSIYPNPNKGAFTIQSTKGGIFELMDVTGKVINIYAITSTQQTVHENLPVGVYFVREKGSGSVQKLIIE
jgi:hypothetical protein